MNIGGAISGSVLKDLTASLAKEYPEGISSSSFPEISPKMQELMQKAMEENGFPEGLMQRLNEPNADNSDVWDAQVAYMAEHPDEAPENFDQLNATIRELAQNPDAETAYLDSLVADMAAEPGADPGADPGILGGMGAALGGGSTGGSGGLFSSALGSGMLNSAAMKDVTAGIKDMLGSGILENLNNSMQHIGDQLSERLENQDQLSAEEVTHTVQESTKEDDMLEIQQQTQQQNQMMQQMNNVMNEMHDGSMDVVENLRGDSGAVIEGEAIVALNEDNVVDADPETEVFDAYRDEDGDSYDDDPSPDQLA